MTDQNKDSSNLWRLSGIGVELVAAIVGFGLAGYGVDAYFDSSPWGLLVGLALGMVGGMYNAVRASLAAGRESQTGDRRGRK